jgi:hypothetical protein
VVALQKDAALVVGSETHRPTMRPRSYPTSLSRVQAQQLHERASSYLACDWGGHPSTANDDPWTWPGSLALLLEVINDDLGSFGQKGRAELVVAGARAVVGHHGANAKKAAADEMRHAPHRLKHSANGAR